MFKTVFNMLVDSCRNNPEWVAKCYVVVAAVAGVAVADSAIQHRKLKDLRNVIDYANRQLLEIIVNHEKEK